jgi:uncharacterized protein
LKRNGSYRENPVPWGKILAGLGAAAGLAGLVYAKRIEPRWLETVRVDIRLPRLPPEFHGYRVVQISDIHMDTWMTPRRLRIIVHRINQEKADLVAITGDFVTRDPYNYAKELAGILRGLHARDGVAAVLGNHDHWCDPDFVRQAIQAAGLIDLNNRVHTLRRSGAALHFSGVDDYMENQSRLDLVLSQLQEDGAAILLAHEPDFADLSAASGRFDLQLSGHSHGGQVALPVVGPPYLPDHADKYPVGLYEIGNMKLYTNRGIGMVHLPFRFNSRPEITVITLLSEQVEQKEEAEHVLAEAAGPVYR